MLQTNNSAERPNFGQLGPGEKSWAYALLEINAAWFYLEIRSISEPEVTNFMFIQSSQNLMQISNSDSVEVERVYMCSPGYLNATNLWQWDLLKSISTSLVKKRKYETQCFIYELLDGRKYYSHKLKDLSLLTDIKLIYEYRKVRKRRPSRSS